MVPQAFQADMLTRRVRTLSRYLSFVDYKACQVDILVPLANDLALSVMFNMVSFPQNPSKQPQPWDSPMQPATRGNT